MAQTVQGGKPGRYGLALGSVTLHAGCAEGGRRGRTSVRLGVAPVAPIITPVKRARPPPGRSPKGGPGGRSGLHRAAQQLTAVHREVRIRATETSRTGPDTRVFCAVVGASQIGRAHV